MTAAEILAEWALALRAEDVPATVRSAACRHLLDGAGCAIAAARTGAAPYATGAAGVWAEPAESTIIGSGVRLPAPMAALANGTLVHALDYDDTHTGALVHPTAAVLPAAFAVGESVGASGADVLAACVAGYETVIRLGAAVRHGFHARGFHATSVCGVFAAALASAKLMGLAARETTSALGIAGSMAAGSLEFLATGSSTKQLHPGIAGMNGIIAARLAGAGAEGPPTILEGGAGLFRAYLGAEVDAAALTGGLGSRWETTRITIKPYAACQLSHPSLDALSSVLDEIDDPARIEEIRFALPRDTIAIVCEPAPSKRRPRTPYEGKFSLPYCAAALLLDGTLAIDSFDPPMLSRPDALALAERTTWVELPYDGAPADAPGVVEIRLSGGSVRGRVETSRGGAARPLTDDEVLDKFVANCASDGASAVAARFLALDSEPSLSPLLAETVTALEAAR